MPIAGPDEVAATAARLRAAQPAWEALGHDGRYLWLGRLRDWMLDHQDELADTLQAESGKVRFDATVEAPYVCDAINLWGKRGKRMLADERVRPHSTLYRTRKLKVTYRPFPLVGVISPWNYPLILSIGDAIPALAAGCAVIIKPSEVTPLALRRIVRAWREELEGPDVLALALGLGETGAALVDQVDFIHFTGSDVTGRKVMGRAAERLIPVSLELGGKDPLIVLRDADLERAANAATWGGFFNSGQTCMAVERIYVEESVYDEFVQKLSAKVGKLRQGADGRRCDRDVGAMTFPPQLEKVERQVDEAVAAGAKALTGGKRVEGPGDWYEPTVLVDVDHSMSVMRDETFGPVVGVMKVRDADEAVRLANDTRYGLAGSVFGGDAANTEAVARRLELGLCNVNDVLTYIPDVPMGGWKTSGVGVRHGAQGIRKFCRIESVITARFGGKSEPTWFPYSRRKTAFVKRFFGFFTARDIRRRLGL